ncbi:NFX1 family protein [Pleurotus pulmonarius]
MVRESSRLPRTSCSDPVPTCTSQCLKNLSCSHQCQVPCHLRDCPPCQELVERSCRCGGTRKHIPCSQLYDPQTGVELEVLCDKPCGAFRACGKHECKRICCPLAGFAMGQGKTKGRRRGVANQGDTELDLAAIGGLHECDLVCGKPLPCGNHKCDARDHRGACPPCLRSSFDEIVCHCGRTVLDPPIPCGTVLSCQFPCVRPPPPCGHPRVPHACHGRVEDRGEEEVAEGIHPDGEPVDSARPISRCPPCPHLVTKPCACGKKMVPNVRCSTAPEKVRCGGVCGKLMECGFHRCDRGCHPGECGDCSAPCGKARRLCLPLHHPCTLPCHAPSACSEAEPCQAIITVSCPCGRIKQAVHCGRNANQPIASSDESSRGNTPKCNSDCAIAKRNARLADALGINPQSRASEKAEVSYSNELVSFAKSDAKFLALVERTFADFVNGEKKNQVLPHMPVERRQFVHDLAALYRIDTQMVDQEPYRSVQLLRRVDTRIPATTLSAHIAANKSMAPNLGKLTDMSLRSGSSSWRSTPTITPTATSRSRVAPVPTIPDVGTSARAWGAASQSRSSPKPSSGTAPHSRVSTPAPPPPTSSQAGEPTTPVPADWEDDA